MGLQGKFRSTAVSSAKGEPTGSADQETDDKAVLSEDAPVVGAAAVTEIPHRVAENTANVVEHTHNGDEDENSGGIFESADSHSAPASTANAINSDEKVGGDETTEGEEDETRYPRGLSLGLLSFGLCMAIFTVALDNTIIATAIPKITSVFDSLDDVGWYGSSYLLTTTALQPSFGRIYTFFSVKWTYLVALVVFELGSIICASARNSVSLIIGRAVAGAGASALFSGGMTIVGMSVPLRRRPLYIALLSSMFGISSVVGPLLGGTLTDKASWRWCFWINLPFGAVAILSVGLFFKPPPRKSTGMSLKKNILELDLLGAGFLICAIVCLLLALQWGGSTYPWSNSRVWGCLLGFGLLIIIFVIIQIRRGDRATIPLRIFSQRTVLWASLYSCFMSMGLYTHIYYLPFYFQAVKGTTAEGSGIRIIPFMVSIIISSLVIGASITTIGVYKPFMIGGAVVYTIGAGLLYTLHINSTAGHWVGYQLLAGFGSGAGIQIPFIAVQVVLSAKDMPTGNAIAIFFNSLGGAISISIAQNIFSNGLIKNVPKYAPSVDAQTVIDAGATYLRGVIPPAALMGVLKAYDIAIENSFVLPIAVGSIAAICACFVEWKSVKGKKLTPGGAA